MRHKAVILGLSLVGVAAAFQVDNIPDVLVKGTYLPGDPGEVRLLGVCDIQSQKPGCWDAEGNPNPTLWDTVKGPKGQVPTDTNQVPHPSATQRLLVFRFPDTNPNTHNTLRMGPFWAPNHEYLTQVRWFPQTHPGFQDEYFLLESAPTQNKASVTVAISRDAYTPVTLPLKPNTQQGIVSIGKIQATNKNTWEVLLKVSGDNEGPKLVVNVQPVDNEGYDLAYVAERQSPVRAPNHAIPGRNPFRPIGHIGPYEAQLGGRIWTSITNPHSIPNLHLWFNRITNVQFRDIPLNPNLGH